MLSKFSYKSLEDQLSHAKKIGYQFLTCAEYAEKKEPLKSKTIVHRVDIDFSPKKAERLCAIFDSLAIKATFFVRLHASEYNPFSFENYRILKAIAAAGHEIGYHSEVIDQHIIWDEDASDCLRRDLAILNQMLGIKVKGVASHGGLTGLNNLDFWKQRDLADFGLLYEAYDETETFGLFKKSFYISDSEWHRWKCYESGKLVTGDNRSLVEHLEDNHSLIYLLIHPDTYYDRHIYE